MTLANNPEYLEIFKRRPLPDARMAAVTAVPKHESAQLNAQMGV